MKKCPFCAEEMQPGETKCRSCGGILDKYVDWIETANKKQPEKWYCKTRFLMVAFLCLGPLALPLFWINPRFSQKTKIIVSAIAIILSYYLWILFAGSMKSIGKTYEQINQFNF